MPSCPVGVDVWEFHLNEPSPQPTSRRTHPLGAVWGLEVRLRELGELLIPWGGHCGRGSAFPRGGIQPEANEWRLVYT